MGNPIREYRALALGGDFWAMGLLLCNVPCRLRCETRLFEGLPPLSSLRKSGNHSPECSGHPASGPKGPRVIEYQGASYKPRLRCRGRATDKQDARAQDAPTHIRLPAALELVLAAPGNPMGNPSGPEGGDGRRIDLPEKVPD